MEKYKYKLCLCDGRFATGHIEVYAEDEESAYDKAVEIVGTKLYAAFPELEIEYYVELDDEEE